MATTHPASRQLRPFLLWLGLFYAIWTSLVVLGNYGSVIASHWGIAVAMMFGSYVAGSTPMGGGTVGFPVLVLLFDQPGSLGRNFGLAIQSVGMVSASIFILSTRAKLDWGLLRPTLIGSLVATPVGAAFVAPRVPDLWVKLLFAIIWASFGVMHLVKLRELLGHTGENTRWRRWDVGIGLGVGLLGGIAASITGVGIDMILYAVMVLLFQADLKISIPSSVIAMAFTSVVGIGSNLLLSQVAPSSYQVDREVFYSWLAAAPIVALGAPLGAWVVSRIPRAPTLIFVSFLCLAQFAWTILEENVRGLALAGAIAGVILMNAFFHALYRWGRGEHVISE